jgi:hypothetical protein
MPAIINFGLFSVAVTVDEGDIIVGAEILPDKPEVDPSTTPDPSTQLDTAGNVNTDGQVIASPITSGGQVIAATRPLTFQETADAIERNYRMMRFPYASPVERFRVPVITKDPTVKDIEKINTRIYNRVDTLQLSNTVINATGFSTASLNGISSQRPEIIALTDYEPMFENQSQLRFNDTGYFIDYKYQLNQLRKDTVQALFVSLSRNAATQPTLNQINSNFQDFVVRENTKLQFFQSIISIFDLFDKAFQPREINEEYFTTRKLLNIKDFFIRKMGYSETSYNTFSDTKILYQLLLDLRTASEDYSFNLLNLTDPSRVNDLNSVNMDLIYTKTDGFTFGLSTIKTPITSTTIKTAVETSNFNNFLTSLPAAPVDRIKLLMQIVNRVLRVSRGLSKQTVKSAISTNFSVSEDDNPFDNIVGAVPRDIFSKPFGVNTIGTSLYVTNPANPGIVVLPFENTIVDDGETTYAPGNLFFKNLTLQNGSISNLVTYSEDISKKIFNTNSIYNDIFEFSDVTNKLLPVSFSLKFLNAIKNSLNYIYDSQTNGVTAKESLIIAAIINYAQNDKTFKFYLFQFFLLLGLSSITSLGERSIFKNLKRELKTTAIFPNLSFDELELDPDVNQIANLRSAALSMARTIVAYISNKLLNTTEASPLLLQENANKPTSSAQQLIIDNLEQIPNILVTSTHAVLTNQPNLLKDFINIAVALDEDATITGNPDTYLNTNLITTKYSNISVSYILLMLFEILCSYTQIFFDVNFDTENNKNLTIAFNKDNCYYRARGIERTISALPLVFNTATGEISLGSVNTTNSDAAFAAQTDTLVFNRDQLVKINQSFDITKKIVEALVGEEKFLQNILGIFTVISENLNNAKRIGIEAFNRITPVQRNILQNSPNALKKSQYRITSNLLNLLRSTNSLIDPYAFSITEDEYNHLLCLNSSLKQLTNERSKILTIGLPNGFIDALRGKASKTAAISGAEQISDLKVEQGLVYLVVYRKSLLYEDLVFKPKRFLFDLSLFCNRYQDDLVIDPFGNFSTQNGLITLKDKSNLNQDYNITLSNINTYSKYITYLTNTQKQEMFVNHVKDYLFSKYINLLTGLKLTEEVFPIGSYSRFTSNNELTEQLLKLYLTTLGINDTRPINQILSDQRINSSIRDSLSLMQNSLSAFKTELIDQIIFSEKMFDRIINIQINTYEDFEVNVNKTPPEVLTTLASQNKFIAFNNVGTNDRVLLRDLNDATMDEFYVSVEGIG